MEDRHLVKHFFLDHPPAEKARISFFIPLCFSTSSATFYPHADSYALGTVSIIPPHWVDACTVSNLYSNYPHNVGF